MYFSIYNSLLRGLAQAVAIYFLLLAISLCSTAKLKIFADNTATLEIIFRAISR